MPQEALGKEKLTDTVRAANNEGKYCNSSNKILPRKSLRWPVLEFVTTAMLEDIRACEFVRIRTKTREIRFVFQ
jgi:hypothetical protein